MANRAGLLGAELSEWGAHLARGPPFKSIAVSVETSQCWSALRVSQESQVEGGKQQDDADV